LQPPRAGFADDASIVRDGRATDTEEQLPAILGEACLPANSPARVATAAVEATLARLVLRLS